MSSNISSIEIRALVSNAYSLLAFDEACINEFSWTPFDWPKMAALADAVQCIDDCGDHSDAAIARLTELVNEAIGVACDACEGDCTGRVEALLEQAFDPDFDPDPIGGVDVPFDAEPVEETGRWWGYDATLTGEDEPADDGWAGPSDSEPEDWDSGRETAQDAEDAYWEALGEELDTPVEIDEMTRWAIENDCCATPVKMPLGGRMDIHMTSKSVLDGAEVGMLATYGLWKEVRIICQLAFEKADALLMWGDVEMGWDTYEAPIGVAHNVDEAMKILAQDKRFTGWEMV